MIFLGSNQRRILNTGVKSHVKIVYSKVKARRKIEYMCQSRGEICLFKIWIFRGVKLRRKLYMMVKARLKFVYTWLKQRRILHTVYIPEQNSKSY